MEAALVAIERSPLVAALRTSFFVYPAISALHILAVGVLLTTVLLMDFRVLGAIRSLPEAAFVRLLRRVALTAFAVAILSGIALFSVRASEYAAMPLFLAKLGLIVLAGANSVAFGLGGGPLRKPLAAFSFLLWLSVLIAGRFLGFV
ncbi:hypothetical protein [Devosia sp. CN2-171]|uniref:hypothetical protein n=1 Tax=Devosia sp. CN2-171 TaxID=3400909 RepID=UPI003BF8F2EC